MTLTKSQRTALEYVRKVGGRAALLEVPGGTQTIMTLAQHGLIGVSVKLTQKARNRYQAELARASQSGEA